MRVSSMFPRRHRDNVNSVIFFFEYTDNSSSRGVRFPRAAPSNAIGLQNPSNGPSVGSAKLLIP